MFCSNISPPWAFHRLKMALLLSLASCSTEESVLAVLAVGRSDVIQIRLLKCAAQIAPRSVIYSSLNEFEGKAFKTSEGVTWAEAGSLLRAKGGVCIVEDLAFIRRETKSTVCDVLENEEVHVEIPTELKRSSHSIVYPLRTCVWSTYNPCHKKKHTKEEGETLFLHVPVGDLTKSVTDVFGLVIYSDSSTNEQNNEVEESICTETLLNKLDQECLAPLLPKEDLIQYLDAVRSIPVSFTKESEKLLRGYYVSIRRLRGDCNQGAAMPATTINTLTKVAKCHAKLSLRRTVEVGDAASAILLCEEALTARTGFSPLGVTPTPHLSPHHDLHLLLGRKNDERMKQFIDRLESFISQHTSDIGFD